ncbi:hypothetical protein ERJ75_000779800 [Trypanosoma vivax]|nr:hypothetical protein ERJ75_000779800 [Trypanosoma vivax]
MSPGNPLLFSGAGCGCAMDDKHCGSRTVVPMALQLATSPLCLLRIVQDNMMNGDACRVPATTGCSLHPLGGVPRERANPRQAMGRDHGARSRVMTRPCSATDCVKVIRHSSGLLMAAFRCWHAVMHPFCTFHYLCGRSPASYRVECTHSVSATIVLRGEKQLCRGACRCTGLARACDDPC